MDTILVVCVGNICRSPLAEALLKVSLPDKLIWSAGLAARVGEPAHPLAMEVAATHGLDLSEHHARQINSWMCSKADLILVMDMAQKRQLERTYPLARGKIRCIGDVGPNEYFQITDPYQQPRSIFESVHIAIDRGVSHWAHRIKLLG